MRDSETTREKMRLSATALALTGVLFVVLSIVLGRAANWAESRFAAYPYRSGEETLNWLMPSIMQSKARPYILITGPSAVTEAVLYEVVADRIGGHVLSAGMSNGTINDVVLGLDYIERVYGADEMPTHIVLGMTSRVLANFPRAFGAHKDETAFAPLIEMINKYSSHLKVQSDELGSRLVPKTTAERASSFMRWQTKQSPRYRTAMFATLECALRGDVRTLGYQAALPPFEDLRSPLSNTDWATAAHARRLELAPTGLAWLTAYRSPYHHMYMENLPRGEIEASTAGWDAVYRWNPQAEEAMVRDNLSRLRAILERHAIALTLLYLPEHSLSRQKYDPVKFDSYRRLIREELPAAPVLDVWNQLDDEKFYDMIHVNYSGARLVTSALTELLLHPTSNLRMRDRTREPERRDVEGAAHGEAEVVCRTG